MRLLVYPFNPFHPSVSFDIETSHLLGSAKQMTDLYIKSNTGLKWVNKGYQATINCSKSRMKTPCQ